MPRRKGQSKQSMPTLIYSFGADIDVDKATWDAKRADPSVITNVDTAIGILRTAHAYKNTLIGIERDRRSKVEALLRQLSPELITVDAEIAVIDNQIDAIYATVKKENIRRRVRLEDPVAKAAVESLKEIRKPLYQKRDAIRKALFKEDTFKTLVQPIEKEAKAASLAARSNCGVFWGTYLCIEESLKDMRSGAPPEFRRFEKGCIGVQLQKPAGIREILGYTHEADPTSKLRKKQLPFTVRNTFLQLDGTSGWVSGRIRIGTVDGTAKPIWLPFHCKLHREIPSDARVTWAKLQFRKIATDYRWELQLTLSREAGWDDPKRELENGVVAIDIGWRKKKEGLRVAYWVDAAGAQGEIVIPEERLLRIKKVEDLASIRDRNFDAMVLRLRDWLKTNTPPSWLLEALATLPVWTAQARLASVVLQWRDKRFSGDTDIFNELEAWRKQDKHLYTWQGHQRDGEQNWRTNLYRTFAAEIRKKYRTAVVELFNISKVAKLPDPTKEDAEQAKLARRYRFIAATSNLRNFISEKQTKFEEVPADFTTQQCHLCGFTEKFDAAASIDHTCSGCGQRWDQDYNACMNMLALSASGRTVEGVRAPFVD